MNEDHNQMKTTENAGVPPKFRLADMHTHSLHSHDAHSTVFEMCEAELARGVSIFAVTDHYSAGESPAAAAEFQTILASLSDVERARRQYGSRLEILRGIEIDNALVFPDAAKRAIANARYDVVLTSIHYIPSGGYPYSARDFTDTPEKEMLEMLAIYFDELAETALTADYDVLTHLTCPLRYMNGIFGRGIDLFQHGFEDRIRRVLRAVIDRGAALEVNTSSMFVKTPFLMPDEIILHMYAEMGGKFLTVGSDAHVAQNAALGLSDAYELLAKLGFRHLCFYRERQRFLLPTL